MTSRCPSPSEVAKLQLTAPGMWPRRHPEPSAVMHRPQTFRFSLTLEYVAKGSIGEDSQHSQHEKGIFKGSVYLVLKYQCQCQSCSWKIDQASSWFPWVLPAGFAGGVGSWARSWSGVQLCTGQERGIQKGAGGGGLVRNTVVHWPVIQSAIESWMQLVRGTAVHWSETWSTEGSWGVTGQEYSCALVRNTECCDER